jgi:hypothetical protein
MTDQPTYRIICITDNVAHLLDRFYSSRLDAQLAARSLSKSVPNATFRVWSKS